MFTLGPGEMVAIFLLALLMFGPKELPKLGKTLGKAISEFRRAQSELKSTFNRELKNLERETGMQELRAAAFQSDSYNYDHSSYDSSYYEGSYDSTVTNSTANGASAPQGAGSTAVLQVEAAAGSIASGHMDPEHAWEPYTPATPAPAEHGHSAPATPGESAAAAEKTVNG